MLPSALRGTAALALAAALVSQAQAATYVVNSAGDGATANCSGGTCTLRAAIEAANARAGFDRIEFDLPIPSTITPLSVLPAVLDVVTIDARPDPGFDGRPQVFLTGFALDSAYGLVIGPDAGGSQVRGIGFHDWDAAGVLVFGANAVLIDGCEFGFNHIGSLRGNGIGIHVAADSATIGQYFLTGVDGPVGAGNTIVGSIGAGILVDGDGNRLRGNDLGTFVASSGNGTGIQVQGNGNEIGGGPGDGSSAPVGNQVWYSDGDGIRIQGNDNRVLANRVGLTSGGDARGNGGDGIVVAGSGNQIGGDGGFDRNRVAYNGTGILLGSPAAATATEVLRNDVHANRGTGIRLQDGSGSILDRNRIFGNGTGGVGDGIRIDGDDNVASRNRIGMDGGGNNGEGIFVSSVASGNFVGPDNLIGNNRAGVKVEGPGTAVTANTIGSAGNGNAFDGVWLVAGSGNGVVDLNRIDANAGHGIRIDTDNHDITGNLVGVATGNGNAGVFLTAGANGNLLEANAIGNNLDGVLVQGAGNQVVGNHIGVLPDGSDAGNGRYGVRAEAGATNLQVEDNDIEGNASHGVFVQAASVALCSNRIGGVKGEGGAVAGRGNGGHGVLVDGADGVRVGDGCSSGNLVAFSGDEGVLLRAAGGASVAYNDLVSNANAGVALFSDSAGNAVQFNTIRDNGLEGIFTTSTVGEGNEFRANQMSGNGMPGIDLAGDGPSANDAGDADVGPNRMQNAPVLLFNSAVGDTGLEVGYSVDAAPEHAAYPLRIEVFSGDGAAPATPSREGASFLGSGSYLAAGVATVTVARPMPGTRWLVATITDADGNTSEFSEAMLWVDAAPVSEALFSDGFEAP